MNSLSQLAKHTTIVADTGDLAAIARLEPIDATTNPSLITAAISDTLAGKDGAMPKDALLALIKGLNTDAAIDALTIALGVEISKLIPGRVSTEVDARLSYNTDATVEKALEYIAAYAAAGVDPERVLIKIASTWEGIAAAEILEQQGIHCNLTLLFTDTQARACADAGVTLISPFVGRITDFQKAREDKDSIAIGDDMGVNSVKSIYQYYKQHGYATQVMGASFRTTEQIIALAGCDLLTISPALLDALSAQDTPVVKQLDFSGETLPKQPRLSEAEFRHAQEKHPLNALLTKGIDGFIDARAKLVGLLEGL